MAQKQNMLPIGIDLGSASVKLIQLQSEAEEGFSLVARTVLELPRHIREDSAARLNFLETKLSEPLKQEGFSGRQCILGLPAGEAFIRHVKIPRLDEHATGVAIRRSVQKDLPCPVEHTELRFQQAGEVYSEGETRQEMIVAVSPHETLDAHLKLLGRLGLEARGVYLAPFALVECFSSLFDWASNAERTVLYIDMGAEHMQVTIAHGDEVVFARSLVGGVRRLDDTLAEALEVTSTEAWQIRQDVRQGRQAEVDPAHLGTLAGPWVEFTVEEVETCLRYYTSVFRATGVERVIFCGGLAEDKGLCQAIAKRLNLPAQVGNPVSGLKGNPVLRDDDVAMSVATGLSLLGDPRKETT